jgi:thiosulfate/3-mercaptopyruvate sulfurtransferase
VWTRLPPSRGRATAGPADRELSEPSSVRDALYGAPLPHIPGTAETRAEMAAFKASARSRSQGVGAVLQALDEHGFADDTLVLLSTDHGLPFPGAKATLGDRGLGVTLIIRGSSRLDRVFHMSLSLPQLVNVATLSAHLDDPALRLFDATVHLRRPAEGGPYTVESGREAYAQGHIPGAGFADIPGELSDPDSPYPFTLPSAERFAGAAGRLGIGPGTHVVAYAQDSPMWATRLWWQLRFFGFDAVSVLDGGLPAWQAAGLPIEASTPDRYRPAPFVAGRRPERLATRGDVEAVVAAGGGACLINALTAPVFRGEGISSYSRPGRIPGSVNAPWTELIDPETNRFRTAPELERRLDAVGANDPTPVIAYCGGGISATVDLFALSLVGRDGARLYDGSLTEWTRDPALPVEVG